MGEQTIERENMILKARVRQLMRALYQDEPRFGLLLNLPPTLANFFGLLMAKEFVSRDLVQYEMNVVADAQVAVWRMRERLLPLGITVHTKRGVGWYLDRETKQRVLELLKTRQPIGDLDGEGQIEGQGEGQESSSEAGSGPGQDQGGTAEESQQHAEGDAEVE
jgi:hypothetical protein